MVMGSCHGKYFISTSTPKILLTHTKTVCQNNQFVVKLKLSPIFYKFPWFDDKFLKKLLFLNLSFNLVPRDERRPCERRCISGASAINRSCDVMLVLGRGAA